MKNLSEYWLREIVIGLNLCPFAKTPYHKGLIRLIESDFTHEVDQLAFFLDELDHLQKASCLDLASTLIVFKMDSQNFLDFNDFVGLCEEMVEAAHLKEHFQLVVFHPQYLQEGRDFNDRANLVGRSPYPTIHLLRNADIETVSETYPNLEEIPTINEAKLYSMTDEELNALFNYF